MSVGRVPVWDTTPVGVQFIAGRNKPRRLGNVAIQYYAGTPEPFGGYIQVFLLQSSQRELLCASMLCVNKNVDAAYFLSKFPHITPQNAKSYN